MTIVQQQCVVRKRCRFMRMVRAVAAVWLRRAATRRALRELEPWQLADTGRTENERRRECAKWFWQK